METRIKDGTELNNNNSTGFMIKGTDSQSFVNLMGFETTCLALHSQKIHFASQVGNMSSRSTGIAKCISGE